MRRTYFDRTLGLSKYAWTEADYDYDDFYKTSTYKDCDVFFCVETERYYIPSENALLGYRLK